MQLEGLNVTFECEAVAEPLYTVEWQLNETSLNNSSNKYLVNPITGQLSIYSVVLEDTGMYTCIVDNIHGNDSASATLTIQSMSIVLYCKWNCLSIIKIYYRCTGVYSESCRRISTVDWRDSAIELFVICCSSVKHHMAKG